MCHFESRAGRESPFRAAEALARGSLRYGCRGKWWCVVSVQKGGG